MASPGGNLPERSVLDFNPTGSTGSSSAEELKKPPIFSSHIWGLILGMLEDSKDIANVVTVIPNLAPVVEKKAHMWRFGQVAPNLVQYLKLEDVFACRLVCSWWSRGLDQFLESNPDAFHEYGYIAIGAELKEWSYPDPDYIFRGVRQFETQEMITTFLQDMEGYPPSRNPFLGRRIRLAPKVGCPNTMTILDMGRFWDGAQQLLRKFGEHVWHIRIDQSPMIAEDPAGLCQSVLNCFQHLPNLKLLDLEFGYYNTFMDNPLSRDFRSGMAAARAVNDFVISGRSPPVNLDSLAIFFRRYPSHLLNFLLLWLSTQLRKLTLHRHGEPVGFPKLFLPKLTDLTIGESNPKKFLLDLFQKVKAPQITELKLTMMNECTEYVMETDIFPFLKKFQQLECLNLTCYGGEGNCTALYEEETLSPTTDSIHRLKSLTINGNNPQLNYDFLRCFPFLKTLRIDIDCESPRTFRYEWGPLRPQPTLGMAPFVDSGRMYDCNVWELLPNLEELTLESCEGSSMFNRAGKARYDNV